jgi:hypothetical protein
VTRKEPFLVPEAQYSQPTPACPCAVTAGLRFLAAAKDSRCLAMLASRSPVAEDSHCPATLASRSPVAEDSHSLATLASRSPVAPDSHSLAMLASRSVVMLVLPSPETPASPPVGLEAVVPAAGLALELARAQEQELAPAAGVARVQERELAPAAGVARARGPAVAVVRGLGVAAARRVLARLGAGNYLVFNRTGGTTAIDVSTRDAADPSDVGGEPGCLIRVVHFVLPLTA